MYRVIRQEDVWARIFSFWKIRNQEIGMLVLAVSRAICGLFHCWCLIDHIIIRFHIRVIVVGPCMAACGNLYILVAICYLCYLKFLLRTTCRDWAPCTFSQTLTYFTLKHEPTILLFYSKRRKKIKEEENALSFLFMFFFSMKENKMGERKKPRLWGKWGGGGGHKFSNREVKRNYPLWWKRQRFRLKGKKRLDSILAGWVHCLKQLLMGGRHFDMSRNMGRRRRGQVLAAIRYWVMTNISNKI